MRRRLSSNDSKFDKDDLFRRLDAAWLSRVPDKDDAVTHQISSEGVLRAASAARDRADARARFSLACFIVAICVIAIAIFMLIDGQKPASHAALLLSLIPLVGGAWHLDRANREKRQIASLVETSRPEQSRDGS